MSVHDYEYEWDSRYCYPNSNVLKNKFGITNGKALAVAEREITAVTIAGITEKPVRGKLNFKHLCDIHRAIFRDIFDWAGKPRTVNISKGNPFCMSHVIPDYAEGLFAELKNEDFLLGKSPDEIPERLTYYLSEINVLHPFREGNGRTQRAFIKYLAQSAGYNVDFSDVSADEMIKASVLSFDKDYAMMTAMFKRITSSITQQEQQEFRRKIGISRPKSQIG
ncbi:MAG: Fic family protein [Gracilibacteraceae bacterium]|jgi:cell filamentation protein|nr:Fic family protein [Gracilibacteraceae bacterium]